jgi:glycerate kinase
MRVLLAPNAFKGTISAQSAAEALAQGLRRARPGWTLDPLPLADGGPGTLEALRPALGGRLRAASVEDALGRKRRAWWLDLPRGLAVVESAQALGLERIKAGERDALAAGSEGLGRLLLAVAEAGKREVLLGLGGTASTDGGSGAARALGWRFLDRSGQDLRPGGGSLAGLWAVLSPRRARLGRMKLTVLCDVDAPLAGPRGAARTYGPQKGADASAVRRLERGLRRLAACVSPDSAAVPGAGAAGGLGFGLMAFAGAELRPGAEVLLKLCGFAGRLRRAQVLVTGEGRLDAQSLQGKLPAAVAAAAGDAGRPCLAVVGRCDLKPAAWRRAGFSAVIEAGGSGPAQASRALRKIGPALARQLELAAGM